MPLKEDGQKGVSAEVLLWNSQAGWIPAFGAQVPDPVIKP